MPLDIYQIPHRVTFYFIKGHDDFYAGHKDSYCPAGKWAHKFKKLFTYMKIPYTIKYIEIGDFTTITFQDLGVLETDLNIVFLPTYDNQWQLFFHSDHIVLFTGFPKTTAKYGKGHSSQSHFNLIRKYLNKRGQMHVIDDNKTFKHKDKRIATPAAYATHYACFLDIADYRMFDAIMIAIRGLNRRHFYFRKMAYRVMAYKKKLFFATATLRDINRRIIFFKYYGKRYPRMPKILSKS